MRPSCTVYTHVCDMMLLISRQECIVYHSEQSLIVRVRYIVVVQCVDLYGTHKSHKSFQPYNHLKSVNCFQPYISHNTLSRLPSDTLYTQLHVHVHYSTNLKSLCNLCTYVHAQSMCVHVFQLPLKQQGNPVVF